MPKETIKWEAPSDKHGKRWNGFLMASRHSSVAGRCKAKCMHCSAELDGKPTLLFNHIKEKCKRISKEDRSTYIQYNLNNNKIETLSNNTKDQVVSDTNQPIIPPQFVHHFTKGSLHHFSRTSKEKTDQLHKLLLKALISGCIPFCFLQNK
ncbi:hypothetical protein DFH28DRAFT_1184170 [Melampsora americana]|nr:hypothetical protein DFH28DRAFT_1184170 [Melampsora americana]